MKLVVGEIPVPARFKHPPPPDDRLPCHPFTMGIIAPKGSGKTTLICNLLKFYRGYFHTILIFSPTVVSDEKWDHIKALPLLSENKKLQQWLRDLEAARRNKNTVVEERPPSLPMNGPVNGKAKSFDPYIPEECFKSEYVASDLADIMEQQMNLIELLKEHGQSKHLANRVLVIFDDLVGSSLFGNSRDNPFKRFNTNHRHYSFSALMVTQAYREIPKTVRTQFSCGILFEIPNEKEIEAIYEENPLGLQRKVWEEVYRHCIEEDFCFMFFNFQKKKRLRIMKNFDKYIYIND